MGISRCCVYALHISLLKECIFVPSIFIEVNLRHDNEQARKLKKKQAELKNKNPICFLCLPTSSHRLSIIGVTNETGKLETKLFLQKTIMIFSFLMRFLDSQCQISSLSLHTNSSKEIILNCKYVMIFSNTKSIFWYVFS